MYQHLMQVNMGRAQQMTLEKAMIEQIQVYYDNINKSWDISTNNTNKTQSTPTIKENKTKLGEFIHNLVEPFRKIKLHKGSSKPSAKGVVKGIITAVLITLFSYFVIYPILGTRNWTNRNKLCSQEPITNHIRHNKRK